MRYILTDWEINGYDDSDFMCSYYDEETNTIGFNCYGSTRYPSATIIGINADGTTSVEVNGENLRMPNAEVVEKARLVLEENIFTRLVKSEKRAVMEPDVKDLREGLEVRLIAEAKMQVRATAPCTKCGGSGHWINPRNSNDKRNCFTCKGTGQFAGEKLKENGKQVWEKLPAGLTGSVVDWKSFGQFYASGYNQPNRDNTTVQFKTADGKLVRAALNKLRLNREEASADVLRKKAAELSHHLQFSALYPRYAWDTHNFAMSVVNKKVPS